jgi:hypothetical protein
MTPLPHRHKYLLHDILGFFCVAGYEISSSGDQLLVLAKQCLEGIGIT